MVTFIVLHYNDFNMTKECVDALLALDYSNQSKIIVIDNGSPNNSGEALINWFNNHSNIDVILLNKNFGFAKGNNIGYRFAKSTTLSNYFVIMNNDVIIDQKNFVQVLENIHKHNDYEIIMPDIINKVGLHQNPYKNKSLTVMEINRLIIKKTILLLIYYLPLINNFWLNKYSKANHIDQDNSYKHNECEMMIPHGSCIIYSKKWIDKEDIAYLPDTFMYGEEEILYEYILNKKYKTYYTNKLLVNHIEDISTNSIANTAIKKAKFQIRNSLFSMFILKKIRKHNDKNKNYIIKYAK